MDTVKARPTKLLSQRPLVLGLAKILFLLLLQLPVAWSVPFHLSNSIHTEENHEAKSAKDASLWAYLGFAAALVLLGGAFAGLTIALMGQDEINLQVIQKSGDVGERKQAGQVLRLLRRGKHWVLVTLLLSNVITNETLPIVLDWSLGGGWPAVLGSTALVVIFGEIVPQSICVRYGLPIGAWMSPFVLVLMYVMAPIAWPTAKLLDYLLGEDHGTMYKKAGLKTLVALHRTLGDGGHQLNSDEVTIISAVLDLKEKTVGSIMTPMDYVFTLAGDDVLDEDTMDLILSQGYSRIPIHAPDCKENFIGMLLVKMLITYDPEDCQRVGDFALATLPETRAETSCLDIVNFFQEGKSHMVLVSDHPGEDHGALGVVTLEDVIEELIGEEIIDESDVYVDVHKAIRRMAPAPRTRLPRGRVVADSAHAKANESEDKLIDIDESAAMAPDDLQRKPKRTGSHPLKTSPNGFSSSPRRPLPHMRRQSTGDTRGGEEQQHPRRANTGDRLAQLKHLGPSNLASRPKATRWATVKIKPGSSADSHPINLAPGPETPRPQISEVPSYGGGVGEGLFSSGGQEAKDGVQAVQHGYGGTGLGSPLQRRPGSSASRGVQTSASPDRPDSSGGTARKDSGRSGGSEKRPSSRHSAGSTAESTLGSLPDEELTGLRSREYTSKGPARSGSITENIVDSNGIQKVVLELTSNSSNEDEQGSGADEAAKVQEIGDQSPNSLGLPGGGSNSQEVQEGSQPTMKKKRRRREKRQEATEESEPLISGDR